MSVLGVVYFLLYLSLLIILGLIWYIYNLLNQLEDVNQDVENIFSSVQGLTDHLEAIYELEMFYGEPVIQALLDHMKSVQEDITIYVDENIDYIEEEEDAAQIEE